MIPAASRLDRAQAVLVVVDVQERLVAAMERRDRVLARTALLIRVASLAGLPTVVTRQYPKGLGELDPVIESALVEAAPSGVTRVDKLSFDCFGEPSFVEAVCATGRKQLLVAGMESHICVTQTCLTGLAEGYDVHIAVDACCSREDDCHAAALARLGHAGAVITTAESAAYELIGSAGTDEFKRLLSFVKDAS